MRNHNTSNHAYIVTFRSTGFECIEDIPRGRIVFSNEILIVPLLELCPTLVIDGQCFWDNTVSTLYNHQKISNLPLSPLVENFFNLNKKESSFEWCYSNNDIFFYLDKQRIDDKDIHLLKYEFNNSPIDLKIYFPVKPGQMKPWM